MVKLSETKQPQSPPTPSIEKGMRFSKILSAKVGNTKYKNGDGTQAEVVTIQAIPEGKTEPEGFHSTAKAIVDTLKNHFKAGVTEPLEQVLVDEPRSKEGRNYLTLVGY